MGLVPPEGFEPSTYGLAYHYSFHCQQFHIIVCGLDHIFAVSGGMRMASTEPCDNRGMGRPITLRYIYPQYTFLEPLIYLNCPCLYSINNGDDRFPRYCHVKGFTDIAPSTSQIPVFLRRLLFEVRCSIQLS